MRRLALTVSLLALPSPVPAAAQQAPTDAGPGNFASPNVRFVRHVPLNNDTAGGRLVGDHFYLTTDRELVIFDVSRPLDPRRVGAVAIQQTPYVPQEDLDTDGRIALVGTRVVDVTDKTNPRVIATHSAGDHTITCILGCTWAYGSDGSVVDLRNPSQPITLPTRWTTGTSVGGSHDVTEVAPGIVVTSSDPVLLLDARDNPAGPTVLAQSPRMLRFNHSTLWPRGGSDRFLLLGGETLGPLCGGASARFEVWDVRRWREDGAMTKAAEYRLGQGLPTDGLSPANQWCTHWFDAHPDFGDGGLVALAWYEHGVRFLDVSPAGAIQEAGWFLAGGTSASAAYWVNRSTVYVLDYNRGFDILQFTETRPTPFPGRTTRVSAAADGTDADGNSLWPAISADGRYVAFQSYATNLVPEDSNDTAGDVFLHDRATGTTELVSISSDGVQGSDTSGLPAISADGRLVAFYSDADNLVPGDTNGRWDVFVRDRQAGTTRRVSVSSSGQQADQNSWFPSFSADGRYVAFESAASNLVPLDTNGNYDAFVHDLQTGATERVSVSSTGAQSAAASFKPVLSADGRYVAFWSGSSTLVPGDTNATLDVFVRDRAAGTTERVSVSSTGLQGNGESTSRPSISDDGRYVAFVSHASNLVPGDANGVPDAFVRDRIAGITERISVTGAGLEEPAETNTPSISPDGRYVYFTTLGSVAEGTGNAILQLYAHDRHTRDTELVSAASDGSAGDSDSITAFSSADGRYVAFQSTASNFASGDAAGWMDIIVRDMGPDVGAAGLSATASGTTVEVAGWGRLRGAEVSAALDPPGDGQPSLGAEIRSASLVHRPERDDALVRIRVDGLPGPVEVPPGAPRQRGPGGYPGVVYGLRLRVGEARYEIRGLASSATTTHPGTPAFTLLGCEATCLPVVRLNGAVGSAGPEVRAALPLGAVGAAEGDALRGLEAFVALGESAAGPLQILDTVSLPDATLSRRAAALGVAPAGTPMDQVAFDVAVSPGGPRVAASLPAPGPEQYDVWLRMCLDDQCRAARAAMP